ncbi:MAG: hypothetical protein BWY90_01608 [Deltaproteobacteria bacterium ADurb.BinA014]|nr:MAG: hypothetical protein BWY90_01608 [Deltaproteobacteria bacterium ADurb.BinA014]
MTIQTVVADIELAAFKPSHVQVLGVERPARHLVLVKRLKPGEPFCGHLRPERVGIFDGFFIEFFVLFPAFDVGFFSHSFRYRKYLVVKILFICFSHIILLLKIICMSLKSGHQAFFIRRMRVVIILSFQGGVRPTIELHSYSQKSEF